MYRAKRAKAAVTVVDPERFARLVREVAGKFSNQTEAAEALGISQAHCSRLSSGQIGDRITHRLFKRLRDVLDPNLLPELWRAVLSAEAKSVLDDYFEWLQESSHPFPVLHPAKERFPSLYRAPDASDFRRWGRWRESQVTRYANVLKELRSHPSCGPRLAAFEQWAEKHGHEKDSPRVRLAILRAIEPLMATIDTDGVELSWEELENEGQLESYVNTALRRERTLLRRTPDLSRAQEIAFARERPSASEKRRKSK